MSAAMERIKGAPGYFSRGGRVVFSYRDECGKQRWGSARNLAEARRLKAQAITDVARGEHDPRARETFGDYARRWVETYAGRTSRGLQPETREGYRRVLEAKAIPFLGRMKLTEIRPLDVKEYAASVAATGCSRDTIRLAVAPVRACLATAVEEGLLRSNPSAGLRLFVQERATETDEDAERVKALTPEQVAVLVEHTPERWRLFVTFLAETGLRVGEAIELRWRDVDLGALTVDVRRKVYRGRVGPPKSRYGRRRIRLTPETGRALWPLRANADPDALVFTNPAGGGINPASAMRDMLKPAAAEAGIGPWVGWHTLRHSCASALFASGWNAVQVQRWLGHHAPSFTLDTYVHLLDAEFPAPLGVNTGANKTTQEDANTDDDAGAANPHGNEEVARAL
jgi:integrase